MTLPGNPSDETPGVLKTGNGDITTLFVSMARRHPDGADADYLRWHTLDHRPEQHRLHEVRASLRLVSTPECRAARAASHEKYDEIDHVMTYFFSAPSGLDGFLELSHALGDAGRKMPLLPPVERGVYDVATRSAARRVKVGADILPWWPIKGVYLLLERDEPIDLRDVDGVAGMWTTTTRDVDPTLANAPVGHYLTYCFLDDDPVAVGHRMKSPLHEREPLLAAPFHPIVPHEWDRYVP
ncbi:hypothetical protein FHT40_000745 [Mycolicibacterium sp. BK556]|uniref:hypothetical protein n=1 Tax=unclassified Mycolicibacterium TaxID=2636767 RepID=UPI001620DF8A|nr:MULTISPECIES: hypothetical protein [unclassified Mycolicibacterium]MBB3601112.1 hypothetical protein [Mycolicibacterium sp. BK556]MBB3630866.1 hypothetical protein [Mycolicibacterium sp. BK607]